MRVLVLVFRAPLHTTTAAEATYHLRDVDCLQGIPLDQQLPLELYQKHDIKVFGYYRVTLGF